MNNPLRLLRSQLPLTQREPSCFLRHPSGAKSSHAVILSPKGVRIFAIVTKSEILTRTLYAEDDHVLRLRLR